MAVSTLRMAALVSGRSAALAKYSPISAEILASFLRFSSFFFVDTSTDDKAPAVTPAKLVNSEVFSIKPVADLAESKTGADKLEFGKPWLTTWFSAEADSDCPAVSTLAVLVATELSSEWTINWLELTEVVSDTLAEVLVDALTEAEVLADILAEVLALTDWLAEVDSELDTLSLSECDKLADSSGFAFETDPRTTESFVAKTSDDSNVFSRATASLAWTVVCVATAPPNTAPVAASPLIISRPVIVLFVWFSTTSVITWVVSTLPRKTLNKPNKEVEARSQCLPDFTNL